MCYINTKLVTILVATLSLTLSTVTAAKLRNFCRDDQFRCSNGRQCRDRSDMCNARDECADASDEFGCPWSGYTWCNFCNKDFCGWDVQGFDVSRQECGLYFPWWRSNRVTLASAQVKTLSKNCEMQIKFDKSAHWCDRVSWVNVGQNKVIGNQLCGGRHLNQLIGYAKNGSKLLLDMSFSECFTLGCDRARQNNKITEIRLVNCDPSMINFDCDFQESDNCTWWFHSTRLNRWQYVQSNVTNYLVNRRDYLAEIRSPLILATGDDGVCLIFFYKIAGDDNYLQVTKINVDNEDDEEIIWSASTPTETDDWRRAGIFIKSKVDFDVGFISSAIDGEVVLDNIALWKGTC